MREKRLFDPDNLFDKVPQDHNVSERLFFQKDYHPGVKLKKIIKYRNQTFYKQPICTTIPVTCDPIINTKIDITVKDNPNTTFELKDSCENESYNTNDPQYIDKYEIVPVHESDWFLKNKDAIWDNGKSFVRRYIRGLDDETTKLSLIQELLYVINKVIEVKIVKILTEELAIMPWDEEFEKYLKDFVFNYEHSRLKNHLEHPIKHSKAKNRRLRFPKPKFEEFLIETIDMEDEVIEIWENEKGKIREKHFRKYKKEKIIKPKKVKVTTPNKKKHKLKDYQIRSKNDHTKMFRIRELRNLHLTWKLNKQQNRYKLMLSTLDTSMFVSTLEFKYEQLCEFWSWIDIPVKDPINSCWIWKGEFFDTETELFGYGKYIHQDKEYIAHRLVYMMYYDGGPITSKTKIIQKCINRCCCNPNHLHILTLE